MFYPVNVSLLVTMLASLDSLIDFSRMLDAKTPNDAERIYNSIQSAQYAYNAINYLIAVKASFVAITVNEKGKLYAYIYDVIRIAQSIIDYANGKKIPMLCNRQGVTSLTQSHRLIDARQSFGAPYFKIDLGIDKYRNIPKHGGMQSRGLEKLLTDCLNNQGFNAIHTGDDIMQSDILVNGNVFIECKGEFGKISRPVKAGQ